jgi:AraC-like DNA-binding protein
MARPPGNPVRPTTVETGIDHIGTNNPRRNFAGFLIEKSRSWGGMSVDIVNRAAGEAVFRSDFYQLTYFLTDFQGTMEDDERAQWECQLFRDNFVFRPPDTTLRSNLTAGRYIQIVQSRDTYANLTSEMFRGGMGSLKPIYNMNHPLVSQVVLSVANEIEGGFLDTILADALNTALAVQIIRLCGNPTAITLTPSNGLSRERFQRVSDYIEAHLDDNLSLAVLADIACLSPFHFSRSFKQAVGIGPQRYITHRRLERAKTLMRRTNLPLALIAQEAGFADQSHLTSVFRREIGVTPGHYRTALA